MAEARILRPAKTAMSSGIGKTLSWILEFEQATKRQAEPLMGWIAAADTLNQVRLYFKSREEAEEFAKKKGLSYTVEEPRERSFKAKSYASNFRPDRIS